MENLNNFQGKRPDQYENSARLAGYSIICMIILLIGATLLGGCAIKKKTQDDCCKTHAIIQYYESINSNRPNNNLK
jgi:hypothetical protein